MHENTKKNPANLRIMTWNVRYFTDYNNNPTISNIAKVIKELNPDIICLQEATTGPTTYYEQVTDIRQYLTDLNYYLIVQLPPHGMVHIMEI